MRPRHRCVDVGLAGDAAGERPERLELRDEDVPVALDALVATAGEEQRLAAHDRAEALVDRRRDDQVHLAELVLDEHEDDALRRRRPLARDREAGHADAAAVRELEELAARERARRQVRAGKLVERGTSPSFQRSVLRGEPKESHAPDATSASSAGSPTGARCARSRTSRYGPPRSRSATIPAASSS